MQGDTKTLADWMVELVTAVMPASDSLLFWTWVRNNACNLRQATADLGVTVDEGPGFVDRLEEAVTPILVAMQKRGQM